MLSLFAPYTAEECWEMLGHQPSVARAAGRPPTRPCWSRTRSPASSRSTARSGTGWRCRPSIGEDELRELALAAPGAERALAGRGVRTVIVRPPKLVNIVSA